MLEVVHGYGVNGDPAVIILNNTLLLCSPLFMFISSVRRTAVSYLYGFATFPFSFYFGKGGEA